MLAIEKWGATRFKLVAALAQLIASSAKECHEVIVASHGPWFLSGEKQPNAWLRLYRQPFRVEELMWRMLLPAKARGLNENTILLSQLMRRAAMAELRQVIEHAVTNGCTQREFQRSQRWMERLYQWVHLPMMRRLLTTDDWKPSGFDGWIYRPELVFFLSVVMPCWLECRKTPWALFQQARRGEFHALESLIRLDPEVDKEQTLKGIVFRMSRQNPAQYKLLNKARSEGRKSPITLADVKYSLGGLLMRWSKEMQGIVRGDLWFRALEANTASNHRKAMGKGIKAARKAAERTGIKCRLKAPDIRALFDSVAQDSGDGLVDADFDGQQNSIYKRLDRNAKRWPSLQETDISRAA